MFSLGEILKEYICKLIFTLKYTVNTPKTLHLKMSCAVLNTITLLTITM